MENIQNGYLGYLAAYTKDNLLLARTMVVKLTEAAGLINEGVATKYGSNAVDPYRPETWKYYMNIAGQYHFSDTVMMVSSVDTLEEIEFSKENLKVHTATANAYRFGTRQYYALLNTYPTQELLINGILNPVDIDTAIAAESGTILVYPDGLVESNESSLIPELEDYIKKQLSRWFNAQFIMSDGLYCAVFFTILHTLVLQKLLNLRLNRCKTNEVHSFHVRMYLASHFELDRYLPYLTQRQRLWLYRNIRQIERNPGKSKTLFTLIDNILTSRGIPIGEYSVRHLDLFNKDHFPEQIARIKLLNTDMNGLSSDTHSVEALFEKEADKAPGNPTYLESYMARDAERIRTAASAILQTKVLHSSMVDYAGSRSETFEEIAVREWCSLSMSDRYRVSVAFTDPKSSESYSLFAKDAFAYMQYLALNADGLTISKFPDYLNMQQRRQPKPTVDDLLSMVDYKSRDLRSVAERLVNGQPKITSLLSVTAFRDYVQTLYDEAYNQWLLTCSTEDLYERAQVENMVRRLYEDERITFSISAKNVSEWLAEKNLPSYDRSRADAAALIKAIFEATTGYSVDSTKKLKNIQQALIQLMTELSSYTIQFTNEINQDNIINVGWPAVRFGNQRSTQKEYRYVDNGVFVLDQHGYAGMVCNVSASEGEGDYVASTHFTLNPALDPSVTQASGIALSELSTHLIPAFEMEISYTGQDKVVEEIMMLPGYTSFNSLSEADKVLLKSIYQR